MTWTTATVREAAAAAEGIRRLRLDYGRPLRAEPGSHVEVQVQVEGRSEVRSYSVVHHEAEHGVLDLGIKLAADGRGGSRYMHGLAVGDRLRVSDPVQDFPLTRRRAGYVLVAGGIGITPLLPMVRALVADGAPARLVYAGRSRSTMAFLDELEELSGIEVDLRVEDEGALVDAAGLVASIPADHELYVCGPIGLLDALRTAWAAAGRPPGGLRFETFGSSGRLPVEEFVVEVPRLALRTTVPANRSLLDALESAGAEMISDCRRGECGVCEVKVLACDGVVDHRDVFLSPTQHDEGGYLCVCVSRAAAARGAVAPARLVLDIP